MIGFLLVFAAVAIGLMLVAAAAWFIDSINRAQERIDSE